VLVAKNQQIIMPTKIVKSAVSTPTYFDPIAAAERLNRKCDAFKKTRATMLEEMRDIGEEAKATKDVLDALAPKKWQAFVAKHIPFGLKRLQRCMRVHKHWAELQTHPEMQDQFLANLFGNQNKKKEAAADKKDVTSFSQPNGSNGSNGSAASTGSADPKLIAFPDRKEQASVRLYKEHQNERGRALAVAKTDSPQPAVIARQLIATVKGWEATNEVRLVTFENALIDYEHELEGTDPDEPVTTSPEALEAELQEQLTHIIELLETLRLQKQEQVAAQNSR
jgi:hypothetical protein